MSDKQERYIETVGAGSQRPYYKVVAPAEWTDEQIKDGFREATKKFVGYIQPKGQHGCAGGSKFPLVDVIFLGDVHRETLAAVNAAPPLLCDENDLDSHRDLVLGMRRAGVRDSRASQDRAASMRRRRRVHGGLARGQDGPVRAYEDVLQTGERQCRSMTFAKRS